MTTFKLYDYSDDHLLGSGEKVSYDAGEIVNTKSSHGDGPTIEDQLVIRPTLTLKVEEVPEHSDLWLENERGERVYVKVNSKDDKNNTVAVKGVFAAGFVGEK